MNIEFDVDFSKVSAYYRLLYDKQMPFALALALTRTAQDAQLEVRRSLPQRFTLRRTFVSKGIRITPAKKNNLESSVYSKDDFMGRQEEGGTKTPRSGRRLAVPSSSRGGILVRQGKNTKGVFKRSLKPSELLDQPKLYFKGEIGGTLGIWKRTGRKDRKGWSRPHVNLMYTLTPMSRIKARFGFEDTVSKTARDRMERHIELAIDQATR